MNSDVNQNRFWMQFCISFIVLSFALSFLIPLFPFLAPLFLIPFILLIVLLVPGSSFFSFLDHQSIRDNLSDGDNLAMTFGSKRILDREKSHWIPARRGAQQKSAQVQRFSILGHQGVAFPDAMAPKTRAR